MNIEELDRKYAKLLLTKCLSFNNTDTLLIEYATHENDEFVNIIIDEAEKIDKIRNIRVYCNDRDELHDYLKNTNLEDIKLNKMLDRSYLNEIALNRGCALHIFSFIPNIMDDIEPAKLRKREEISRNTMLEYKMRNTKYDFPWTICTYPNKRWANLLFKDDPDAFIKLYDLIIKTCMVDHDNPSLAWDKFMQENNRYKNRLNELEISKLYYRSNKLGTEFDVCLPPNHQWLNPDKTDYFGSPIMVNMPSYEIFTSPDCRTTNGIVYNSRPFIYNGIIIDNFKLEFKNGKVVGFEAKEGKEELKTLLESFPNSNRLGEVALVNYNSPISNLNTTFFEGLLDENASCHLALGKAPYSTIKNCRNYTQKELNEQGFNDCLIHEDFMIGIDDLEIIADTNKGKQYIFKKGNFSL